MLKHLKHPYVFLLTPSCIFHLLFLKTFQLLHSLPAHHKISHNPNMNLQSVSYLYQNIFPNPLLICYNSPQQETIPYFFYNSLQDFCSNGQLFPDRMFHLNFSYNTQLHQKTDQVFHRLLQYLHKVPLV